MAILHTTGPLIPALSGGLVPTNLVGNFVPTAGINTTYWDNQASGNNLRRFNGITHSTTDPDHFLFDGSNDYLGRAGGSGYGGSVLSFDPSSDFTIGQWFKYNNVNHQIFQIVETESYGASAAVTLQVLTSNDQAKLTALDELGGGGEGEGTNFNITFSNFTFSDDVWYYVTLVHDSGNYYFYVNGSFVGSKIGGGSVNDQGQVIQIGATMNSVGVDYTGAGTKVGHIHMYTRALLNSQIRQNFLHIHDIHNTRWYGRTYES